MSELELFEAYMKKEHPFINVNSEAYAAMHNLWQARVPKGYVVVPIKCTNNMAHAAKEVDGRLSAFKYGDVWKAMIEAVEQ